MTLQLAVQALAGDVVPIGAGRVVGQQRQPVVEAAAGEDLSLAVDGGRPTGAGVTGGSEADHPGLAGGLTLGDVVEGQLPHDEGQRLRIAGCGRPALGDHQFGVRGNLIRRQHIAQRLLVGRFGGVEPEPPVTLECRNYSASSGSTNLDYDGTMKALPPQFQQNFKALETRYVEEVLDGVTPEDATAVARYLVCMKWVAGLANSREGFLRDPQAKNPTGMAAALGNRAATYDGLAEAVESVGGSEALADAGRQVGAALRELGDVDRKVISDINLSVLDKMREEREATYAAATISLGESARGLIEVASELYAPGIVQTLLAAIE